MPSRATLDFAQEYREGDIVEHNGALYRFRRDWVPRTFSSFENTFIQGGILENATPPRRLCDDIHQRLENIIVEQSRSGNLSKVFLKYFNPNAGFLHCANALKNFMVDHAVQLVPWILWIECEVINFPEDRIVEFRFKYRPAWTSGPITTYVRASYELLSGGRVMARPSNLERLARAIVDPRSVAPDKPEIPETVLPWEEV